MEDSRGDEQVLGFEDEKSSISKVSSQRFFVSRRHLSNGYRQVESNIGNITDFSCKHNGKKQKEVGIDFGFVRKESR